MIMVPMIDQVRERTDDLHRVADDIRRERDLRSAVVTLVARVGAVTTLGSRRSERTATACDGDCLANPTGQAA